MDPRQPMRSISEPSSVAPHAPRRAVPSRHAGRRLVAGAVLTLPLLACGGAEPELQVEGVAFAEEDLRGLSPERQRMLAALAALGVTVAEERVEEVGAPMVAAAERRELRRMLRDEVVLEAAGLDEEDLRARYEEAPEYELEVRHLLKEADEAAPEPERESARQRAQEARERALAGEPFEDLAAELSEEPGAEERGGLLQPGREGTWVDPFWEAALALEEGEVSDVVETMFGFHVLRLEERRIVPFEEARGAVLRDLAEEVETEDAWTETETEARDEVEVDEAAAEEWREDGDPEAELAQWPDGVLTGAEFREYAATLELDVHQERVEEASPDARADVIREAALEHLLADRARERGLSVPEGLLDEARLGWSRDVERWNGIMGFQAGIPPEEVRQRALEALGATGQNYDLGRRQVVARLPLFRSAIPVEWRDPDAPGGP